MDDFFKYLSVGEEDKAWGLYLNVAGKAGILANKVYPSSEHPSGYYFSWKHGRILQEYQLIYITEGEGIFENEHGVFPIKQGMLIVLQPGVRHRYKPNIQTGWTEHFIGFNGTLAYPFLKRSTQEPFSVIACGIREEIIDIYYKIYELVRKEEPGFQAIASGLIIKLLGHLYSYRKRRNFSGKPIEKVIQIARFQMREHIDQKLDLQALAESHHIGYAYLRKMFKKYTGVSPHQYHLEMKIMKAKELILSSDKSIKEISYETGFESIHYFSRLFKQKTGMNPTDLRKREHGFDKDA